MVRYDYSICLNLISMLFIDKYPDVQPEPAPGLAGANGRGQILNLGPVEKCRLARERASRLERAPSEKQRFQIWRAERGYLLRNDLWPMA
jgi:hypothetical protein